MVSYQPVLAAYVHDLNPVIVQFSEKLMIRWYGLAYLLGFLVAFLLLKRLAERKLWVLPAEKTGDFISVCALAGVFVGGRLGYLLFYFIPDHGWDAVAQDPRVIYRVWDGGMASHGGIIGLVLVTLYYARKYNVSWTGVGDGLCVVAPLGILFGRLANFINGELYGHVARGVAWAVKFPQTLVNQDTVESSRFFEAAREAAVADDRLHEPYGRLMSAYEGLASGQVSMQEAHHARYEFHEAMVAVARDSEPVTRAIEPFLEPRHPSQLYEGLLEGLALFAILWIVRVRFPRLPHGILTGLFFILYAVFRIVVEEFRLPDSELVAMGLTKGQFLSLFMVLAGIAFLAVAYFRRDRKGARPAQ